MAIWQSFTARRLVGSSKVTTTLFSSNLGPHGEKVGDRVKLIECTDDYTYIAPGTEGTVSFVDDAKTVFVDWDSGSKLGLVHHYDKWYVIPSSNSSLKVSIPIEIEVDVDPSQQDKYTSLIQANLSDISDFITSTLTQELISGCYLPGCTFRVIAEQDQVDL